MSTPSTQIIALWVQEELGSRDWVSLRDVAINAVQRYWGKPLLTIEDLVDGSLAHIANALRNDLAERFIDGKVIDFEIDDEQPPYLRRLADRRPSLLEKLRKINPFDFELVCSKILEGLGAESAVTQKSSDGGIDFTAVKLKILHADLPMPQASYGIVIGQAKRYREGAAISETRLREFVGASILKRHKMSSEHAIAPLTPTLFAFWTTSDLEINAKKYARNVGLWFMDGVTLSTYVEKLELEDFVEQLLVRSIFNG